MSKKKKAAAEEVETKEVSQTMYFRVKAGKHTNSDGRTYRAGQIIESDEDIRAKWPNKFEKVSSDEVPAAKKALKRQENEASRVIPIKGHPGHELEMESRPTTMDDDDDHIPDESVSEEVDEEDVEENEEAEDEEEGDEESASSKLGEDVSEDYTDAAKAGMSVFKKGREFFVTKEDDTETALNKKPLKSTEIKSFIKEQRKKK